MQSKAENDTRTGTTDPRKHRTGWGILFMVLVGVILTGVAVVSTQGAVRRHFGHGRTGHLLQDPELARERAEFATSWVLSRIDATDEQQQEIKAIIGNSMDDFTALVEQHRQSHEAWIAELSKPTLDRAALEQLRKEGIDTADAASKRFVDALADAADVLTPEQRIELIEMAHRFHGR